MSDTVWVALPYYDYEGYGVPEGVFASKELAEAWRDGLPDWRRRGMEILETPFNRSPDKGNPA
jgi:hypothetical protein